MYSDDGAEGSGLSDIGEGSETFRKQINAAAMDQPEERQKTGQTVSYKKALTNRRYFSKIQKLFEYCERRYGSIGRAADL